MAPIINALLAVAGLVYSVNCLPTSATSTTPTLPLSEVSAGLPSPTGTPVIIALGVGTQNYTCNSTSLTFGTNVAKADLYDVSKYIKLSTKDSITKQYLQASQCKLNNPLWLNLIGHHFFPTATTPTFNFSMSGKGELQAKKIAGVTAPSGSNSGVKGEAYGAVDWIYLQDNGLGVSQQLSSVYRVETAGGKPPASCKAGQHIEIPYAAEYWFYD
jgi:hypothetical protein